jgi:histidyl-tRNA synthetase
MFKGALPGFRDFYPQELAERAYIMNTWREVARRYAFVEYDGPPLEPLELYTRKSGDEIVGQLYNFVDKGDREVALRPEMTPTVARMVAARANALRKPVRWFSMPQLFRYERQQKGRLREHYQLNVDIFGEPDVTADAELLAVAIDIMRALGLTADDVRARVSDRRLMHAILRSLDVAEEDVTAVFAVIDKFERQPVDVTLAKLAGVGMSEKHAKLLLQHLRPTSVPELRGSFAASPDVQVHLDNLERYFNSLGRLGVADSIVLDLTIVRGLAYYTGIVFEIFDAMGQYRAICGGGRYDSLLESLGGAPMPALGFGMGDVVLSDLLRDRGLLNVGTPGPDIFLVGPDEADPSYFQRAATILRRGGASVEYPLRNQTNSKQMKAGIRASARYLMLLHPERDGEQFVSLVGNIETFAGPERAHLRDYLPPQNATLVDVLAAARKQPLVFGRDLLGNLSNG